MERAKNIGSFLFIFAVSVICLAWYSPGEDNTLVVKEHVNELNYKEAQEKYPKYELDRGILLEINKSTIERKRGNLPFKYSKDTIKSETYFKYKKDYYR